MKSILAVILSFIALDGWLAAPRSAMAQSPLGVIEGQIRGQAGQGGAAVNPAAPATGRPYLGAIADDNDDRGRGVRILSVRPGGPAERFGLKAQDLIGGAASSRVRQMADLTAILDLMSPGDRLVLEVLRQGQPQKVEIVLGQQGAVAGPAATAPVPPAPGNSAAPPPAAEGPTLTPVPSAAAPAQSDSARIEQLHRRIEQLERRVQDLEQTVSELRRKP